MKNLYTAIVVCLALLLCGSSVTCSANRAITYDEAWALPPESEPDDSEVTAGDLHVPHYVAAGKEACDLLKAKLEFHVGAMRALLQAKHTSGVASILKTKCEERSLVGYVYFSITLPDGKAREEMIAVLGFSVTEEGVITGSVIESGRRLNENDR
jgi:hypothetical protein